MAINSGLPPFFNEEQTPETSNTATEVAESSGSSADGYEPGTETVLADHGSDEKTSLTRENLLNLFLQVDPDKADVGQELKKGVPLIQDMFNQISSLEDSADQKTIPKRIELGMVLIQTKKLVKKQRKKKWVQWVKEHIDFMGIRSVQDYMKLAQIPGIKPWAFLTKRSLLELAPLLANTSGSDPLTDLFSRQGKGLEDIKGMTPVERQIAIATAKKEAELATIETHSGKKFNALKKYLGELLDDEAQRNAVDFDGLKDLDTVIQKVLAHHE